jgi:hypothetical protein
MDWFFVDVNSMERCRKWWERLLGGLFAKEDMAREFDGLKLVKGCLLDTFYGHSEPSCCIKDAICGCDFEDRNGMVFILECVGDTFATCVLHDNFDAWIMLEGWADVPPVQCMKTPQ